MRGSTLPATAAVVVAAAGAAVAAAPAAVPAIGADPAGATCNYSRDLDYVYSPNPYSTTVFSATGSGCNSSTYVNASGMPAPECFRGWYFNGSTFKQGAARPCGDASSGYMLTLSSVLGGTVFYHQAYTYPNYYLYNKY